MDWRQFAIDKLKNYSAKKASITHLTEEIRELEYKRRSIHSAMSDGSPISGGTNKREDMLLNTIVLQKELTDKLKSARRWVAGVETGLDQLTEEEKNILTRFFIHPEKGAAERLAMELGVDTKTVYYRKDKAVETFTRSLYGCIKD